MNRQDFVDILLELRSISGNLWMDEDVRLMQSEIDIKLKEITQ